jgi:hypothetical protein
MYAFFDPATGGGRTVSTTTLIGTLPAACLLGKTYTSAGKITIGTSETYGVGDAARQPLSMYVTANILYWYSTRTVIDVAGTFGQYVYVNHVFPIGDLPSFSGTPSVTSTGTVIESAVRTAALSTTVYTYAASGHSITFTR